MAFQPVPDVAQLQIKWRETASPLNIMLIDTYWSRAGIGWPTASIAALLTAAASAYNTNLDPLVDPQWERFEIAARDLGAEFGASGVDGTVNVGSGPGGPWTPYQVAALLQFRALGPPRRGWAFWPFIEEASIGSNSNLTSAYKTTLRDAFVAFVTAIEGTVPLAGVNHVIISRFSGSSLVPQPDGQVLRKPTPRATGVYSGVDLVEVRTVAAAQRNRRPGH